MGGGPLPLGIEQQTVVARGGRQVLGLALPLRRSSVQAAAVIKLELALVLGT